MQLELTEFPHESVVISRGSSQNTDQLPAWTLLTMKVVAVICALSLAFVGTDIASDQLPNLMERGEQLQEIRRQIAKLEEEQALIQSVSPDGKKRVVQGDTKANPIARYMGQWRAKVEESESRYSQRHALPMELTGSVFIYTTVRADGGIEKLGVIRSSGKEILDNAALHIVQDAAPFPPFPDTVKEEAFDITRTMHFNNGRFRPR